MITMRRLLAFVGGVLSGGVIGTAVALLFAPESGNQMRQGMRQRYQEALKAGQVAAEQKRRELETQLAEMTGARPGDTRAAAGK
jgi:gas vesicle protein